MPHQRPASARLVVVVAIGVIGAVVVWWLARATETPAPTSASGAEHARTGSAAVTAPAPPVLADAQRGSGEPALPATPTPRDLYAAQTRDDEWATTTEGTLRKRFAKIRGGTLSALACHETVCELVIAGTKREVGQTIADLEGARGIHDISTGQFLTAPEARPDGSIVLKIYASFER